MVGRSRHRLTMYTNLRGIPAPDPLQYPASNALRHTPPQAVNAPGSTPLCVAIDPYTRSMAARDLSDTRSVVVKATVVQGNHGYSRQGQSESVLQTNAFMRPQSASLVPLEAVLNKKDTTVPASVPVPRQVGYQSDAVKPIGQAAQVRGSQLRYSTRSLSTQWLHGMVQAGMAQSAVNGAVSPYSPGQTLAGNTSGQVIQVRYGTSSCQLNGTPVGANGVPISRESGRTMGANRSHPEQVPGSNSRCEYSDPSPSDSASLCGRRYSRMGRFDDATAFRGQTGAAQQGTPPTRGASSSSGLAVQTGATTSLCSLADSVSGNLRSGAPDNDDPPQARRQTRVDMSVVSALVDKMRNASINTTCSTEAISSNPRSRFEPRAQPRKHSGSSLVSTEGRRSREGGRAKGVTTPSASPIKPQTGVAGRPPSGAADRPVAGLGPRNQLISQEKWRRMPVTNTLTGSPFPGKSRPLQDLGRVSNPRPLPPAPSKAMIDKTGQKLNAAVENGRRSSSCVDTVEVESLLGMNDTEFDSVDDENGSDDLNSYLSDEESSQGTNYSSPSPTIQNRSRSYSAKLPAKSVAKRNHDNDLPSRKMSTGSKSAGTRPSPAAMSILLSETEGDDCSDPLSPLTESLFSNVPPTINFVLEGQKVEPIPSEFRKLLKWRMSPITPNVVKQCIGRSGFKATCKSHAWLGYWGKHMKPAGFKTIRNYQKMNHFPGTFQLGRKDRLWRNLSRMLSRFGKREFDFFPQTYILPADLANLKTVFEDGANKTKWIIKPPASARGIGIQVVHKWCEIPKNRPVIVQRYLAHPYLINDSKFDLRIYVYVTSFDPLRIYVYDDGLARFASVKYSYSLKNLHNRFMHLTNYSINKRNVDYESNSDEDVCQGHKWSLKALWLYLQSKGVDSDAIWLKIKDLVIKTIISTESIINSMVKANVRRRYSCHELFGFDVLLDEKLKPWLIEVNISPSLHSNSQLDVNVKGGMIRDLFNLAGFLIPEKYEVVATPGPAPDLSTYEPSNDVCLDRRLWTNHKSSDVKAKHLYYTQRSSDEQVQSTILDILTPDDIRMLTESVDENSRRGDFQRVFPSPASQSYQAFFDQPRYYNLLLQAWCHKYPLTETKGISMLESYCRKGIHLQNPTSNTKHMWVPPTLNSFAKDLKNTGSSPPTN